MSHSEFTYEAAVYLHGLYNRNGAYNIGQRLLKRGQAENTT